MTAALAVGGATLLLALLALALLRPEVALLALVGLDASNINQVIADGVGVSPYRPLLALALVALFVLVRRRRFRLPWSPVSLGVLLLLAGFCLSFVHASDPVTSQALLISRSRDLLYYVVVLALVISLDRIWHLTACVVVVLAALAALTVFHEYVLHNQGDLFGLSRVPLVQESGAATPRHAGTSSDVNFWARLLILITPLAMALWAASRRRWPKVFWGGSVLSLAFGVYLTQSRGGFIALLVAVVTWLLLAGGRYRRSVVYLPIVLAVLVPVSGIGSRLLTLTAVTSGATATADPSVVTRKRLQVDALRMFVDQPLTGHGIGSYGTLFPRYDRVSDFYQPVDIVVAAHNFYLEQAADGGIVLLLAWTLFLGAVILAALRARARALRSGDANARYLAVGVVGGVAGWMVASVFLHLSDFRTLLVVAVVAAALDIRTSEVPPVEQPRPAKEPGRPGRRVAVAVALASALGFAGVLGTSATTWSSAATLGVVSTRSGNASTAYQLDVISRGQIVPTLAAVLSHSVRSRDLGVPAPTTDVSFSASQSRLGGAVVVTTSTSSAVGAATASAAAVALAKERVSALQSDYVLVGEPATPIAQHPLRRWALAPLGLVWLMSVLVLLRRLRPTASGPRLRREHADSHHAV